MRKYFIISLSLFLTFGLSQQEYYKNQILEEGGIYIKNNGGEVVNGKVFQVFSGKRIIFGHPLH